MKVLNEFKDFAMKGNMLDMAIGIIIGASFGTVVNSLVSDIIMPVVAWLFGSPDFSNLFFVLKNPSGEVFSSLEVARESGAVVLGYGLFLNSFVSLVIVAGALFLVVKAINKMRALAEQKKTTDTQSSEAKLSELDVLLKIKDLLKK